MYFPGSRACFLRLPMPFVPVPRGFGRAPRGTAVPLSSGKSVEGLGRIAIVPAAFGYFPPVESTAPQASRKEVLSSARLRAAIRIPGVMDVLSTPPFFYAKERCR